MRDSDVDSKPRSRGPAAAVVAGAGLLAWGLALLVATAYPQTPVAPPDRDDRALSAGPWSVVSVEMNGKPIDPELLSMLQVVYRADGSWAVLFKSLPVAEGRSTNRQDHSPKTFEMETLGSESMPPVRYTGIYRLEGDTRELCFVPDGKPRPDDFRAPRRSGRILVTLRRPAEPAGP